jgi:pantetheine-phosphate adenylyltransferase
MKKAVYAGSFDPFTNGHLYIYNQAIELFDRVYILLATNQSKIRLTDINKMCEMIKSASNCSDVYVTSGLVADFCFLHDVHYLVRGIRNTSDYLYEEEIASANLEINPGLKTVYFRAGENMVSSSLVRLLHEKNKDVSKYLPQGIEL